MRGEGMKDDGCLPLIGFLIVFGIVFWFGVCMGGIHVKTLIQEQAVSRGFAEWVLDANGQAEWKWKE